MQHRDQPPAKSNPLFRAQVSGVDRKRWLGDILLAQPVSGAVFIVFSVVLTLSIGAALYFVEYTRKERVVGQVVLDKGLVKIFPQTTGTVTQRFSHENDVVQAGQVLFTISTERSSKLGDTQQAISTQLALRTQALHAERDKQLSISAQEEVALRRRVQDVATELAQVQNELDTQRQRVQLAKAALQRSKELYEQNFVSQADTENKQQEVLSQTARLQSLERTALNQQK